MYAGGGGGEAFAGEDVEEGGLAGAVCADEEAAGAPGEGEGEVVEGGEVRMGRVREGEGEVGDVDGGVRVGGVGPGIGIGIGMGGGGGGN